MKHIRNFSIIAHIDHGKSTLADRLLEATGTIPERKMKAQVLDAMDLERERGITIKMTPVTMMWHPRLNLGHVQGLTLDEYYVLNLIDTPGHIDFAYEVSRSQKAVEGAILLVDSTQGVQAQTLSVLEMARELQLVIIPALSKVDAANARTEEVKEEVTRLLQCGKEDILETSGKTGYGVSELLQAIVQRIPPPTNVRSLTPNISPNICALVFDFEYSTHRGIIVYARVFDGSIAKNDRLRFAAANESFGAIEVGVFSPESMPKETLGAGEIGYIVTGIKQPGIVSVGDTLIREGSGTSPLSGYLEPKPVIWASVFPENQDSFHQLHTALSKLRLTDASLSFEEESSSSLGRGFRCGFLGMLHLEIITERLKREHGLSLIVSAPTITYTVLRKNGAKEKVCSPHAFPREKDVGVEEPWVVVTVLTPNQYVSPLMRLLHEHEAIVGASENFSNDRLSLSAEMPLRELMRNFFDKVKTVSSGFASVSYEHKDNRHADVVLLEVLVADEMVPAFSKIISRRRVEEESKRMVQNIYDTLPRQLFETKIQARVDGRIVSAKKLPVLRKDVTGHLYGGDVTRKRKLLEKQKKGKKKMKERGKVHIPHEVFLKIVKSE